MTFDYLAIRGLEFAIDESRDLFVRDMIRRFGPQVGTHRREDTVRSHRCDGVTTTDFANREMIACSEQLCWRQGSL